MEKTIKTYKAETITERREGKMYSMREEAFNVITHGLGVIAAIFALVVMLVISIAQKDANKIFSAVIYGSTLSLLYTSSTLYHAIQAPKLKSVLRVVDHCTIFLLIAGTYTPITVSGFGGKLGWGMFVAVWVCAIVGIILNAVNMERFKVISMVLYFLMGWFIITAYRSLLEVLSNSGVMLLVLGGVVYTIGIVFYALKNKMYMHGIWHLFVLGGSVLHCVAIILYIFY